MIWKQHIPEGVQDFLPDECYNKRKIENILRQFFYLNGYDEVDTPIFEYLNVFSGTKASIEQEKMYRFFEPGTRTMVLRPDITMPIARLASTKLKNSPKPLRLSYISSVYRYEDIQSTKQREVAQAGVELLGAQGPEGDAEIIAVAIQSLIELGLKDFQVDIGQVEFFKGLVEEAGLNENISENLRSLIDRKDMLGLEIYLRKLNIDEDLKTTLLSLPKLYGTGEMLEKAKKLSKNTRCKKAIENIIEVYTILKNYGLADYVIFDLGMVQSLNYYTGIIFRGMTKDLGYPIFGGGRYDNLVSEFGVEMPATGFAMGIKRILMALDRQDSLEPIPDIDVLVVHNPKEDSNGYKIMMGLIREGKRVEAYTGDNLKEAKEYATGKGIKTIMVIKNDKVEEIEV